MRELVINRAYKHFKGKYYYVYEVAINSEDGKEYVVYRQLYGEHRLFVRPLEMFLSEVDHQKYPEVTQKYRFELVENLETDYNISQ